MAKQFVMGARMDLKDNFSSASRKIMKQTDDMSKRLNGARKATDQYRDSNGRLRDSHGRLIRDTDKAARGFRNAARANDETARAARNAESSVRGLTRAFRENNGASGSMRNGLDKIRGTVTNSVIAPFKTAIGMVKQYAGVLGLLSGGALASKGMGRLSAIENASVALEVMMGDATKAQAFLDEVLAFAKTTPFAFPDLAETSRNLIAFGMAENKVVPTLKAIGDAAAATGKGAEGLRQVSSAFGDMQISSELSLGPIRSLEAAGIPALKILANQAGVSTDSMMKAISDGKVGSLKAIDALVEGMQKGTKGLAGSTAAMDGIMERMKKTWVGSIDSLKSSISSTMAKIMTPIKPHIQDAMAWFGKSFSKIPDIIYSPRMKLMFSKLGRMFTAVFKEAWQRIEMVSSKIKAFVDERKPQIEKLGTTFVDVFTKLAEWSIPIIAWLRDTGVPGIVDVLVEVAGWVLDIATYIQDNWKDIAPFVAGITGAFVAYRTALMLIDTWTKIVTASQWLWNAAMTANPIGLIIVAIGALIGAGIWLYQNWDKIKDAAKVLGITVEIVFKKMAAFVGEKIREAREWGKNIILTMARGIGDATGEFVKSVTKVFNKVRELMPFSDAKDGPFSQLTYSGGALMTTLAEGAKKQAGVFRSTVADAFGGTGIGFGDTPTTSYGNVDAAGKASNGGGGKTTTIGKLFENLIIQGADSKSAKELVDDLLAELYRRIEEADDILGTGDKEVLL